MGVYVYTLRKDTIEIDGKTIGRIAYAYKPSWRDDSNRVIQSKLAKAELARDALGDLDLVAQGDTFRLKDGEWMNVFHCSKNMSTCYDTPQVWNEVSRQHETKLAGYLVKRGRKLVFETEYPKDLDRSTPFNA